MAASAINRHIIELEQEVGIQLFERGPHGMKLSAAGEILIHRLRSWRSDADRTRNMIADLQHLRRGHVRIALVEGPLGFLLDQVLEPSRREFPQISFDLNVGSSDTVVDQIEAGDSEIGLTFNPPRNRSIRLVASRSCAVGVAMSTDHQLAGQDSVKLQSLVGLPVGLPSRSATLINAIEIAEQTTGCRLWRSCQSNSIGTLKLLARTAPFVVVLSDIDVYSEVKHRQLVHRSLSGSSFGGHQFALIASKGVLKSIAAETMLVKLQEAFEAKAISDV